MSNDPCRFSFASSVVVRGSIPVSLFFALELQPHSRFHLFYIFMCVWLTARRCEAMATLLSMSVHTTRIRTHNTIHFSAFIHFGAFDEWDFSFIFHHFHVVDVLFYEYYNATGTCVRVSVGNWATQRIQYKENDKTKKTQMEKIMIAQTCLLSSLCWDRQIATGDTFLYGYRKCLHAIMRALYCSITSVQRGSAVMHPELSVLWLFLSGPGKRQIDLAAEYFSPAFII